MGGDTVREEARAVGEEAPAGHMSDLIFNEGYAAAAGDALIRADLCAEALRLALVLTALMPSEAEALGLYALLLLQDSRRRARASADGDLILLEDQDRTALPKRAWRTSAPWN